MINKIRIKIVEKINVLIKRFFMEHFNEFYLKGLLLENELQNSVISSKSKIYPKYVIRNSFIDAYTYISQNSVINNTQIGKFCSIGPNLICGWGVHPIDKLSTSPMFYSTLMQNGFSFTTFNKVSEFKNIEIGNDVFIGMNVTILDGISIGNGAVIGAGAVVSKNIPPYAVAVGNPIRIIKYRFKPEIIKALLRINWWDWVDQDLKKIEDYFDDVEGFILENYDEN